MRLVTWNLGHRRNGNRCPDRFVAALAALQPDIVSLVDRTHGAACQQLLEALEGIGLRHRLMGGPEPHGGQAMLASRLDIVRGSAGAGTDAPGARHALHVYVPAGELDVVSPGVRPPRSPREESWDWLHRTASALKERRTVFIGDFESDSAHDGPDDVRHLHRFISEGWQHAVPAEGAARLTVGRDALHVDHAFLSPSLQRIETRYELGASGSGPAGSGVRLFERPALVVDLQ